MYRIVTAADVLAYSRCAIVRDDKDMKSAKPCQCVDGDHVKLCSAGTLSDIRMGPRHPGERCPTCFGSFWQCPGHSGHIELAEPVFARHFLDVITVLLRKLCSRCLQRPALSKHCLAGDKGEACKEKCDVKWEDKDGHYLVKRGLGAKEVWNARRVHEVLSALPPDTLRALEIHADVMGLVPTHLSVPPTNTRPYSRIHKSHASHSQTTLYASVLTMSNNVAAHRRKKDPQYAIQCAIGRLQLAVYTLYDAKSAPTNGMGPSSREPSSIVTALTGKKGLIRRCNTGKRVDYSGRSVISCDSYLDVDQVGIPASMAAGLA